MTADQQRDHSAGTGTVPVAGVITAGSYSADDPVTGLREVLELISFVEQLGFDTVGVRQRHLERGISSALTFLGAAAERTSQITLESNVVPLGFETPFRLAEDFATVWALAAGRLHIGVSSSAPHADLLADLNRPDADPKTDAYELIARFLEALEGRTLSDQGLQTPYGIEERPHVQPNIPGPNRPVWLGGGSNRSVDWAAQHGLNLFLGNLTDAEGDADFRTSQFARVRRFRRAAAETTFGRERSVAVERVLLPTDTASAEQRAHYREFASSREARTHVAHGARRTLIARDLHGSAAEIAERLAADPVFDGSTQLRVSLPYGFELAEYRQILTDIRERVLPLLGWEAH
ncbi:LLM class flavin-dependent oxidoreductase [Pseudoclavibacter sp. CFCC 13611]|uniref:LLM class flavin-dependent oxidoreductase n=1 Tax=Pseudoclavibacter sp. CFCC 13611 TaxID=2615178 RepID=UPI001300F4C0|nr:LLM class flavin-dependent oxidoreductase [Pseudoclavibacter sp. CFCC 13611]KAB1664022.1 LLM class flavin-dependent oxidoreductase [Pseudoclavibacter sp. CFCC 13611]